MVCCIISLTISDDKFLFYGAYQIFYPLLDVDMPVFIRSLPTVF